MRVSAKNTNNQGRWFSLNSNRLPCRPSVLAPSLYTVAAARSDRSVPARTFVTVHVDLNRIRSNAVAIKRRTRVDVLAVVKADAYSLGAERIVNEIQDVVDGYCTFVLREAVDARIYRQTRKKTLCLGPPISMNPEDYRAEGVTPAVSDREHALLLKTARPALCVDTGMQRFACPAGQVDAVLSAGDIQEAFTHGTRPEHARQLQQISNGRVLRLHAAATALLDDPNAYLNAVRPGLALYEGAVRVTTTLFEVHDSAGPAGYGGFVTPRFGVILMGYAHGLRPGIVLVNGQERKILEIGMQSAFIEASPSDKAGDPVHLLDEILTPQRLANVWSCSPQEVLVNLCRSGRKVYID